MDCKWLIISPSLSKGIKIINELEETKFEKFVQRIVTKLKNHEKEIFNMDEIQKLVIIFKADKENLHLAIKTIVHLFKRMLKFIFMPINLKDDLKNIGLENDKCDVFVKLWSQETRNTLTELGSDIHKNGNTLEVSWKVNAELSSEYQKKCKISKTYLSLSTRLDEIEIELTHPELHAIFLQSEIIQNELDNLI